MRRLIEQYQNDDLKAGEFERTMEFHLESLEFIDLDVVHHARGLCHDLVRSHFWDGDVEFGDADDADKVRAEFYQFLDGLPVGPI